MATSNKNFKVKNGLDVSGAATASSFVKTGGSANQFLKADGSISNGGSAQVSTTPPSSPATGDLWYNSETGQTFVYYDSYWVENIAGVPGPQGPTGATGPAGTNGTNGTNGVGVPTGGTTGQILAKSSNTDYATEWIPRSNSGAATMGYQLLTTTYQSYITINMTCTGRPVVVSFDATHANMNSGSNRAVYLQAMMDGVRVGNEVGVFSLWLNGGTADTRDSGTYIVIPSAGTRSFTFQASASANSACAILAAQLAVFEI